MEVEDYIISMRRYFHEYPELSFKEYKTADKIEEELKKMGLSPKRITETGIICDIRGNGSKTVAIRADMDALPVQEENNIDYKSKNPGVMHACGHDTHMAMLLGVAKMFTEQNNIPGTIRLIFQPAEENPPGGAVEMIKNGALDGVDYIIGQHIWGNKDMGKAYIYYHEMMANADRFVIKLTGKGGHGSAPQDAIDVIYISGHLIEMIHNIVSREIDPQEAAVITIGTINAGFRFNVIASHAELTGTVRTFNNDTQAKIERRIKEILEGLKLTYRIDYEYDYIKGYPVLINNEEVSRIIEKNAAEVLGQENIVHPKPDMGGEDFAYYLQKVPGAYYFLGGGNREKGIYSPNHSPTFNVDERSLKYGAMILKKSAEDLLKK
ncbi:MULTISPECIES: M20 family metallopeptidase [Acidiplasma]|jgi:amidohydrolase|uniref:N-acyl-L-amino acid amidohydrolase n=2 Tax=Acidiplasma TaxID=507753 RepID=A0A0Q0VUQ8_9ARCH|nr:MULTISPECIES: amidohydrolase [Acidiplasma]KJE49901.1 N-acyl-L-amino acid amidohydrolase [Acidiplasma sp. MBA-1]KPV46983.1 N-acyl-L-amino acid amidohydrolase [Acidiplasma aeolicum]KQB35361.1 N-acyl-L-amino acid amidohydrolase [Acidiplasma cupricumulans]WMT55080.1 MAG: amidohydrolase [Acidiplasma sp.]